MRAYYSEKLLHSHRRDVRSISIDYPIETTLNTRITNHMIHNSAEISKNLGR